MKFEERILVYQNKLNETDEQIIEYIKENKEEVSQMAIQKLAKELFIVPNTILRLSHKLGYGGFSELKIALKRESTSFEAINSRISHIITKTYEIVDMDILEKVAKKMLDSKRVLFYGVGDSLPFCEMMSKNLKCINEKAEFFNHRHDMIYSARNVKSRDLIFAISISGETKQVTEAVTIAKKKEVFIVSLTHLHKNTLANLANVNLYCWAPKQKLNGYDVTDRTSLMMVLRKLSEYYWQLHCV